MDVAENVVSCITKHLLNLSLTQLFVNVHLLQSRIQNFVTDFELFRNWA
jgi:hypothetical protein